MGKGGLQYIGYRSPYLSQPRNRLGFTFTSCLCPRYLLRLLYPYWCVIPHFGASNV